MIRAGAGDQAVRRTIDNNRDAAWPQPDHPEDYQIQEAPLMGREEPGDELEVVIATLPEAIRNDPRRPGPTTPSDTP
jgi:hypothetical protein